MSDPSTVAPQEESAPNATAETTQETVNEVARDEKLLSTEVPRKGKRGRPRKNFPEVRLYVLWSNLLRINFIARVVAKLALKGHMLEYEVISWGLNLAQLNIDHQCLFTFSPQKPQDDGAPVIKRPRGRPKGSKNKNPKVWRRLSQLRCPLNARYSCAPSSHC